jgi:transcriptional regulator with XRE-family HTH domain
MSTNTELGRVLRATREAAGLTQNELADCLGVSLWTYNRFENGARVLKGDDWVERLPPVMRRPVVACLTREHERQIAHLRRMGRGERRLLRPTA